MPRSLVTPSSSSSTYRVSPYPAEHARERLNQRPKLILRETSFLTGECPMPSLFHVRTADDAHRYIVIWSLYRDQEWNDQKLDREGVPAWIKDLIKKFYLGLMKTLLSIVQKPPNRLGGDIVELRKLQKVLDAIQPAIDAARGGTSTPPGPSSSNTRLTTHEDWEGAPQQLQSSYLVPHEGYNGLQQPPQQALSSSTSSGREYYQTHSGESSAPPPTATTQNSDTHGINQNCSMHLKQGECVDPHCAQLAQVRKDPNCPDGAWEDCTDESCEYRLQQQQLGECTIHNCVCRQPECEAPDCEGCKTAAVVG